MISEASIKAIQSLNTFAELREHIKSEIDDLNSVSGLEELSNADAGEEVKIRAKTIEKLVQIFNPIISFRDKKDPSTEDVQRAKNRTGL